MTLESSRQKAFEKLRPPCVELSQIALQYRSNKLGPRKVLDALQIAHQVLDNLGRADALDEKLANYAFFPLQHVFNEAKRISSGCLELAVRCLQILVSRGWRDKLDPAMGKQFIILLSLLAGGIPGGAEADTISEELVVVSLECMYDVLQCLSQSKKRPSIFDESGAQTLVDQSVYMLLEKITDNASPKVQIAASSALRALYDQISNRVLLASLFPRTVSALTKALRTNTKVRRTYKALVANIRLLSRVIEAVLNDRATIDAGDVESETSRLRSNSETSESTILDASWLKATSVQVKLALTHVMQQRYHDRIEVREALVGLCEVIVDTCSKSLAEAIPLIVETLVILSYSSDNGQRTQAFSTLSHLVSSDPAIYEVVENKLRSWTSSLPRIMQGNDDTPKQRILRQIATSIEILARQDPSLEIIDDALAMNLCESIAMTLPTSKVTSRQILEGQSLGVILSDESSRQNFDQIILHEKSQQGSLAELDALILQISSSEAANSFTDALIKLLSHSRGKNQLTALWLTLRLLRSQPESTFEISDFINVPSSSLPTRPYMVDELYNTSLSEITDISTDTDWRLTALSLESVVLQAQQLGQSFQPELIQVLYPMLSFLGSGQEQLQLHAITALNLVAKACEYGDVASMLVENVDYLINAISLEFTSSDISPQAAQVLLMMVRLCGAKVIPYLDDMIESIFQILDQYHGYPKLVEMLFEVLSVIIDEGAKQPKLAITDGKQPPNQRKSPSKLSTINDLIGDLERRRKRLTRGDIDMPSLETEEIASHPRRPWTSDLDRPRLSKHGDASNVSNASSSSSDASSSPPEPDPGPENDKPAPLTKPHNLFLSITNATPPHLSSPSPRVRLTILRLITRIAPFLSTDENSFLPAINAIWPSLVARLVPPPSTGQPQNKAQSLILVQETSLAENGDQEPTYTITASAEAIAALCRGAGDFMSSRIEALFPELQRLFISVFSAVYTAVERQEHRRQDAILAKRVTSLEVQSADSILRGNDAVVLKTLVELLRTILDHVRLNEDVGDDIVRLLVKGVINIEDVELDLLRDKLRLTRLPKGLESAPWTESKDTGLTVPSLRTLHEFWLNEYSWRDEEKRLNQFPQFITTISLPRLGDLDLHFIHSPSAIDGSVPLLFLHGWPGSCFEVSHALPALNEAGFDVVAPSLLGFGFSSDYPNIGGVSFHDHATVNHHLMLRLGYKKYIVQGGDWGASVTRSLALLYPEHVQAIHVNYFTAHTPSNPPSDLTYTPFERKKLEQNKHWNEHETGYFFIQHQRPLALGIGLHDSPIGMLAWMADKLLSWSDAYSPSNPTGYHWSPTELITWTLLHYFPGPTRSFAIYAETDYEKDDGFKGPEFVNVPTGVSAFKEEKEVVPRKWAEAKANVVFWRDHPEGGGHFAMYERPAEMVADIRKFAEQLRMLKKGILP